MSPSSVIIVAGGGGGAGTSSSSSNTQAGTGGYGGGLTGGIGISGHSSYSPGGPGTQTQGGSKCSSSTYSYAGSFGQGGNQTGNTGGWGGGGGGGGYYGGGSGGALGATGGGGSGYVGGVTAGETHAGNETFLAPDGTEETGHTGNGHARVTFSTGGAPVCQTDITAVPVNIGIVTIADISAPQAVCHNNPLDLTAPTVTVSGTAELEEGWEISADNSNWESFNAATPVSFSQNEYFLRYHVSTNACGDMYSNTVQITVNDQPVLSRRLADQCGRQQLQRVRSRCNIDRQLQ